jgi:hypothetical protein
MRGDRGRGSGLGFKFRTAPWTKNTRKRQKYHSTIWLVTDAQEVKALNPKTLKAVCDQ